MENNPQDTLCVDSIPLPAEGAATEKIYRVGTLCYTLRGLFVLALWLLWGDFAFTFFENIFSRFIPFYLKDLHASNTLISCMTGSFAGLLNLLFLPNISQWSDHYRNRLGRRIPVLYVATFCTVLALLAVGFAPEIGGWIHAHLLVRLAPAVSQTTVVLASLCAFVISYHFFNMLLVNAYNWLLNDVVPLEVMARFFAWFRIVGNASSFVFLWCVFPYLTSHRKEIFLGVGLFYLAAFVLMCFKVKEGEYPPPPPRETRPGILKSYAFYFRDCLRLPIYRNFFIYGVVSGFGTACAGPFSALFARDTLGLSMDDMGKIFAWGTVAATLVFYPMGWLCDRLSPLCLMLCSVFLIVPGCVLAYFLVNNGESLLIYGLAGTLPGVGVGLGYQTLVMQLFPKKKFAQFQSGTNIFFWGSVIFGNYMTGKFMDLTHSNYRLIFLWSALMWALSIFPLLLVYRDWKKYGGPHNYVPPLPPEGDHSIIEPIGLEQQPFPRGRVKNQI